MLSSNSLFHLTISQHVLQDQVKCEKFSLILEDKELKLHRRDTLTSCYLSGMMEHNIHPLNDVPRVGSDCFQLGRVNNVLYLKAKHHTEIYTHLRR